MNSIKSFSAIVTLVFASLAMTSCNTPAKKVEKAEENVVEANQDLQKANEDLNDANREYLADVENYRRETSERINANNERIAELKVGIHSEKKEAKAAYIKRISELEQKNKEMEKKMDDYKTEGKENWEIFKKEFNHDMDELGQAFKDITVKNVK